MMGVEDINPHGWIYDYQVAEMFEYPPETVRLWMADGGGGAEKYEPGTWRIAGSQFLMYRDAYMLSLKEFTAHKRGRPNTRSKQTKAERKTYNREVLRHQKYRERSLQRLAEFFPELSPQEAQWLVDSREFLLGISEKWADQFTCEELGRIDRRRPRRRRGLERRGKTHDNEHFGFRTNKTA